MKLFIPSGKYSSKTMLALLLFTVMGKIVLAQAPGNDLCAGAITLTSGTTCSNTAGTVANATFTAAGVPGACAGTVKYDVWYKFTAKTTNPTITLSSIGANFSAQTPMIQIFSGTCGAFSTIGCSASPYTIPASTLTIGATYYLRIYSTTAAAVPTTLATFNICITDPAIPVNDDCANATLLTSGSSCNNTAGNLFNTVGTAAVPSDCGAAGSPDVWYKFVAQSPFPTITLSSPGASLSAAGTRLQLLSGACGSWTSLACVNTAALNTYTTPGPGSPLTVGATYYVRVYSNASSLSGPANSWGFNICITEQAIVDFGKSYVNLSKGTSGGTIEPGDVLEVRAIYVVKGGTTTATSFLDTIPTNTTYVPGTLRIATNEGQTYKAWTDAADADPAKILLGQFITINMGTGATNLLGGTVKNTDRPTNFGSTCIMVASYRVKVNAVTYGSLIDIGGGKFTYTNANGYISNINFPAVTAVVYKNYGICANTIGSNGVLSEYGGTFGSGNAKDRVMASTKVALNYTLYPFSNSDPQDYRYGISNNSSSGGVNYSIVQNDPIAVNHVFNVWDIIGDHTGAAIPALGNPPADTTGGKTGGYMVVINAAFKTDTAFLDTVKNLCPNTYYEYSAWFRNMCKKCSGDSTGKGPSTVGYVPTGPGDSSGVHPNLTYNINGYDYYTTGDILYTGSWVKKGFTYLTGPAQTQMIISIRNNAPGGGGNDWAIDDIGVATCTPNLALTPSASTVNTCFGDSTAFTASVTSYFNNYTEYIWERSTDGGTTWLATGFSGTGTPVFNGTEYVYNSPGPKIRGDSTTNNNVFRLRVASSSTNLADPNCSFSGTRTVQVLVHDCMWLLNTQVTGITGQLKNNFAVIQWQSVNESGKTIYQVEKSADGTNFSAIGTVTASGINGAGSYTFNDAESLLTAAYYRIKILQEAQFRYTRVVMLSPGTISFDVKNLVNPFGNAIQFDVVLPSAGDIKTTIFDNFGRVVQSYTVPNAARGINALKIPGLTNLTSGIYTLKTEWHQESKSKRIIKINN